MSGGGATLGRGDRVGCVIGCYSRQNICPRTTAVFVARACVDLKLFFKTKRRTVPRTMALKRAGTAFFLLSYGISVISHTKSARLFCSGFTIVTGPKVDAGRISSYFPPFPPPPSLLHRAEFPFSYRHQLADISSASSGEVATATVAAQAAPLTPAAAAAAASEMPCPLHDGKRQERDAFCLCVFEHLCR